MAHNVFGNVAGDDEVKQIISTAGFGAAAAHFESAERMPADHRAGAAPIYIDVSGDELGFGALDVRRAAREKSGGERELGVIGNANGVGEIARF